MEKDISYIEKSFIHNVIGPQLRKEQTTEIEIFQNTANNVKYAINYCIIDNGDPHKFADVIVLVTGFFSGWTGISKLAYDLVKLGYQVCMVSLAGYGNSSNYDASSCMTNPIKDDAEILAEFIKKILPGRGIHLIGHSMGANIITHLATNHPENINSITLLNPAGFEKRGMIEMALKFAINGFFHGIAFHKDRGWNLWLELKKFLPKEKSPVSSFDRLRQRFMEWSCLCNNDGIKELRLISNKIPIAHITSAKDFVFPEKKSAISIGNLALETYVLPLWHNTTMLGSELTAKAINNFICNVTI
jgi:pimeloyl-ACP methyl ester carboxylesterase